MSIEVGIVKAMVFPAVMYRCESWTIKKAESWITDVFKLNLKTVVLEKTLESPLDCKEIKPVRPKGNQPWIFIGKTDAEGEAPVLWPPDMKNWLIGKDPEAGKDWRPQEKVPTEDETVGWHHWLDGWASSGSWWWTGKLVMLQSMGLQSVRHDWVTELNWTEYLTTKQQWTIAQIYIWAII